MASDIQDEVVVINIRMPFWSMVVFMVKLALASIPAAIILTIIYFIAAALLGGLGGLFGALTADPY